MGTIVIGSVSGSVDAMCGCVSNMRTVGRLKSKEMLESGTAERGQCGIVVRWDVMWVCGTMGIRISFSREQGGEL